MKCDVRRLVEELLSRSRLSRNVGVKTVMQLLSSEEKHDRWEVCRGHDLMAIMTIGMKYIFGANNSRNMTDSMLSGAFRLAFDRDDIIATDLFKETSEWCAAKGIELWSIVP